MTTLKLHVEEPAHELDPIPFPAARAPRQAAPARRPAGRFAGDSIARVEDALAQVDRHMARLQSLMLVGGDDDRPRAA